MPKKQDGTVPAADSDELEPTPTPQPTIPTTTISVTIPTVNEDEELDDDDVILDDVAVDPAAATIPAAGTRADDAESPATEPAPAESAPDEIEDADADPTGEAVEPAEQTDVDDRGPEPASAPDTSTAPSSAGAPTQIAAVVATVAEEREDAAAPQSVSARRFQTGGPEPAATLTADRLLAQRAAKRTVPDGTLQRAVYFGTGRLVNLGDARKSRAHKELTRRIAKPFAGSARFVPVLSRKGGVGKTTVSVLLGMALADARDDRIIAIDANPDRGTLADRIGGEHEHTVRDAIRRHDEITGYTEFSTLVARDETRLDVLASDADPHVSAAFDDKDYEQVAELAARYYSMVLTDCGTGIVHEVMAATLDRADSIVIVSGASIDEARLASETISWLEANGHDALAKNAVVALNIPTQARHLVKLDEVEAHFRSRVRGVVRIPFDPALAAGSTVEFAHLKPATRAAARELAASVVEGLPTQRPVTA
ncbi:MinD-like ATPase involved in chromosome partitioning or flagellar assembly [Paramicrobacterium humi]|uniref:MinD-like ATPase involved in chromosome partitioning or flagellar assembly n=1 Tax=Paramicrobacterium humi TaxID=640635 RepID=A0A1H4TU34_9MICO|nr:MinD/ParA family protein [Microbacterium humi]SEC60026.1 MinD-like ATPase involved in chromosome partitioning or flagellar assembly [Microbacterium humi]